MPQTPSRHRVGARLPPAADKRWLALLEGEGGTQQYHVLAAIELYCLTRGYGPNSKETK